MIDNKTESKKYPLPHPENIASQDVERIATAITMIDADMQACSDVADSLVDTLQELNKKALRIPTESVGKIDPELKDLAPRQYIVVNNDATGFSTVEGGGGQGGEKGEILVKRSDANFDTTWMDPRAILKRTPTIKETTSDAQLQNNGMMILAEVRQMDLSDDLPQLGLTQRQIDSDVISDSAYTYVLCDEIDDTAEDDSDIATHEKFGRVKIGSGINLDNGTISVPIIGVATEDEFGLVKIGDGLEINDGVVSSAPYQHADHENFGIIKPSTDFDFDSNGALQLAHRNEDIIYQTPTKNIVEDGVIKIVPDCAYYRAFINTDTLFSFDFGDFAPKADIAFDFEIISDGSYVVNFGSDVVWDLPCAGVKAGTTVIHFEKLLGAPEFRGTLKQAAKDIRLLTPNYSADINADYICGHNGCKWQACQCMLDRGTSWWEEFENPTEVIWRIDFMRSTYVEYLRYVQGIDNWSTAYFYIEGSVDGKNWKQLLTRVNVKPKTYTLDEHGFFKHYRIRSKSLQISNFQWYGFDVEDDRYELQRVMPIMQSDAANGFAITSSGLTSGSLYGLTDEGTGSWANFETRLDGKFWVKYQLPEPQSVDMIDLCARYGDEANRMPTWFIIEGSNDDTNWDLILERALLTRWYTGESRQYWIYNKTPYKYYRLTSIEQPTVNFSLCRFRLYKKIDGTEARGFVPTLSSNSQGGYEVNASSVSNNTRSVYHASDKDTGTAWVSAENNNVDEWLQIKFPTETLCTHVWLRPRNDEYYTQAPTSFEILGSNDGENFTIIKTFSDLTWTQTEQKVLEFYNDNAYLYYRVHSLSVCDSGTRFALSELNLGTSEREYKRDLSVYRRLTPVMTAASQNGFILTANSTFVDYYPYKAFNRTVSDSSSWRTRTQSGWIQVELPEADKANTLKMSGGCSNEEPDSFILYGSNDGESYTELLNSGALTWKHNETKTWNLRNEIAYKFYKVEAVNKKSSYMSISEIQLIDHIITREY